MEPDYKWIAQDTDGEIYRFFEEKPQDELTAWINGCKYALLETGKPNPNWRNSLIDLEKEDFEIVDGILVRKQKARKKLTDTDLLDAIMWHKLSIGEIGSGGILVWDGDGIDAVNKKGNIRKAIKKWLKKNVDKKETKE